MTDSLSPDEQARQERIRDEYRAGLLPEPKFRWVFHAFSGTWYAPGTGHVIFPPSDKYPNYQTTFLGDTAGEYKTLEDAMTGEAHHLADLVSSLFDTPRAFDNCHSCGCRARDHDDRFACRCGTPEEHRFPDGWVVDYRSDYNGYVPRPGQPIPADDDES